MDELRNVHTYVQGRGVTNSVKVKVTPKQAYVALRGPGV
jgi:hypothetical protein